MSTKNNPGKYDCYAKAMPDEPFMTLLARDPSAPRKTREWAVERLESIVAGTRPKEDIEQVVEAMECADAMETWRIENNGAWRNPDLFIDAPISTLGTVKDNILRRTPTEWFFIDETGDENGPYRTKAVAEAHLVIYCDFLDNGPSAPAFMPAQIERDFEDAQTRMRPGGSRFGKIPIVNAAYVEDTEDE